MTDFSNFNPDNHLRTGLTPGRQGGPSKPDGEAERSDVPQGDRHADLKMDPDRMMSLLAAQSRANIQPNMEFPGIEKSIDAFTSQVTPERHAQVTKMVSRLFADEFQNPPNPEMLQQLVDDFLIGQPSIRQNA